MCYTVFMKVCGSCKELLPESNFRWKSKEKTKLQSYCIECNKIKNREHYQLNKKDYAAKRDAYRAEHGKRMRALQYGLTLEQLVELEEANNGLCAICLENKAEHIDHCHVTGKVRALLCKSCNNGLGFFRDNPVHLERAAEYVRQYGPLV